MSDAQNTARVLSCTFPTKVCPPRLETIPGFFGSLAGPIIPAMARRLPEEAFARLMATGASFTEKDLAQALQLNGLFASAYRAIRKDAAFRHVISAMPFCYAPCKAMTGHLLASLPCQPLSEMDSAPIVFLHGFGGNFLFYLWMLREAFPRHPIIAPSWGINWAEGELRDRISYLLEALAHTESVTNTPLPKPWLVGLSDGGRGGFEIAAELHKMFRGYISLAAVPSCAFSFPPDFPILMLCGKRDSRFPLAAAYRAWDALTKQGATVKFGELEGDHFFFLSEAERIGRAMCDFMAKAPTT